MKTFFTAGLALAMLSVPASAATIKAVWNQSLDSPANVAADARVTLEPSGVCSGTDECRRENAAGDRADRRREREEEEKELAL